MYVLGTGTGAGGVLKPSQWMHPIFFCSGLPLLQITEYKGHSAHGREAGALSPPMAFLSETDEMVTRASLV